MVMPSRSKDDPKIEKNFLSFGSFYEKSPRLAASKGTTQETLSNLKA